MDVDKIEIDVCCKSEKELCSDATHLLYGLSVHLYKKDLHASIAHQNEDSS
jgi:hypothetical protein